MQVEVISDQGDFNKANFERFINSLEIIRYNSLAIVGSQNKGKSTILNRLFGTTFDMMAPGGDINRTSRGINVAERNGLLVYDVEGMDSGERGEGASNIENKLALFALVASDILIINMMTQDCGTYAASGVRLLRTILAAHSKLVDSNDMARRKKIIFFLRDFNSGLNNLNTIRERLISTMARIWQELEIRLPLESRFEFEVFGFSNFIYRLEEFLADCNRLAPRFYDSDLNDFLFERNPEVFPLAELPNFFEDVWSKIQRDEDLNIPSAKLLLMKNRCMTIKQQVLNGFAATLEEYKDQFLNQQLPTILDSVQALIRSSEEEYNRITADYAEEVSQPYKTELSDDLQVHRRQVTNFKSRTERQWERERLDRERYEAAERDRIEAENNAARAQEDERDARLRAEAAERARIAAVNYAARTEEERNRARLEAANAERARNQAIATVARNQEEVRIYRQQAEAAEQARLEALQLAAEAAEDKRIAQEQARIAQERARIAEQVSAGRKKKNIWYKIRKAF